MNSLCPTGDRKFFQSEIKSRLFFFLLLMAIVTHLENYLVPSRKACILGVINIDIQRLYVYLINTKMRLITEIKGSYGLIT